MIGVCIATYNQEKYIAQCIESVLMQECTWPIRLYIGNDCSTDSTAAICQQYANQYPNIQLYNRAENLGLTANTIALLQEMRNDGCEFIAMLDGDDYWLIPNKLQQQMDYLLAHPECGLVHTAYATSTGKQVVRSAGISDMSKSYGLHGASTCNCTVLFRASLLDTCPLDEFIERGFPCIDYPMYGIFAQHTHFSYLPNVTAEWRTHASTSRPNSLCKMLKYRAQRLRMWKYLAILYPTSFSFSWIRAIHYILLYIYRYLMRTEG